MIDVHDELVAALAHRYDIERELGHGGMAIVYLARDARHGRPVAVKVLRPELATSLGAERFLREINIAARLTHPNILTLHDSGEAAGMLYYVMPYIEGETLRDRLERERQLPVDESVEIARQVGLALDYAHQKGVVHRDIKPENILLVGDHVLVADFGLARALHTAGTRITESAVAVGTPAYMSPEQAAADPEVDGRTDLYSLACVLFEMIAGVPPFSGATGAAVMAQHLAAKPPSICSQRPHCPKAVDAAVERALEKAPADRYRTAHEFVAAMTAPETGSSSGAHATPVSSRRAGLLIGAAVLGTAVAVTLIFAKGKRPASALGATLDSSSYVVLPPAAADSAARGDTASIAEGLRDALGAWGGVTVIGRREVSDRLAGRRGEPLRLDDALDAAAQMRAGRLVWGELETTGGHRIARLSLYDVGARRERRTAVVKWTPAGTDPPDLRLTANALLRSRAELPWSGTGSPPHPSLQAWLAYDAGREAAARWDLAEASRQLRRATEIDPANPRADLWLTVVQLWSGVPSDRWRAAARRAYERRAYLDPADTALATAQLALAEGRNPDACAAYRRFETTDTTGVVAPYGLGECQSRDSVVVRDPTSPSGWRFRGSMNQAIHAYLRIVEDRSPPQPAFVYSRLAQLLYTSGVMLRAGHPEGPARIEFGAFPALAGDTLVFTPFPLTTQGASSPVLGRAAKAGALEHNRKLLRRLYRAWADNAPQSLDAHEALTGLLESLEEIDDGGSGRLSAMTEVRRARSLATSQDEKLRLARTELRLLVKSGDWVRAGEFADSLFSANPNPARDTAGSLAGPAALTGRIRVLASILRARGGAPSFQLTMPNGTPLEVSPALEEDAAGAFAFAMSGACTDTIRGYRQRVERQITSYIPDPVHRAIARGVLLRRPLAIAVPCVGAGALSGIDAAGDRMVLLEQSLAAHDATAFRATFSALNAARSHDRPGDIAMDYTYMESWMLAAMGDTSAAVTHLDQSLDALPTLGVYVLIYPAHSAALVRAMGLRAELASAQGDRATAARWGRAVATLWAHADPELQPYVRRMCALDAACSAAARGTSDR